MTKYEWDRRLRKALKDLPAEERRRVFEYYDELFEDRMDGGAKEEAIVGAFGEPEAAAKKILADYRAYLDRDVEETPVSETAEEKKATEDLRRNDKASGRSFCDETDRGGAAKTATKNIDETNVSDKRKLPPAEDIFGNGDNSDASEAQKDKASSEKYRGVRKLKINVCASDVTVKRSDCHNVKTCNDDESSFEITVGGDTLYIKEKAASFWKSIGLGLFGGKGKCVKIELPELESVTFDSMRCGCEIEGFDLRRVTLKTVNGDLTVADCNSDYTSLSTTSGNLSVTGGRHDSVALSTVGGDIKTERLYGKSLTAVTMSGDEEALDCRFDKKMLLKTVSGDINAKAIESNNLECKTVSGDSNVNLVGDVKDHTIYVRSVSGNIRSPRGGEGEKKVTVSSVSGEINIDVKE